MRFWYLDNILYMCLCVRECQHSHARYGNSTLSSSTHCHEGLEGMRPSAMLASTNRTPISVTIVIGIRKPPAVYSFSVRYFFYTNGNFASVIANQHMCVLYQHFGDYWIGRVLCSTIYFLYLLKIAKHCNLFRNKIRVTKIKDERFTKKKNTL